MIQQIYDDLSVICCNEDAMDHYDTGYKNYQCGLNSPLITQEREKAVQKLVPS